MNKHKIAFILCIAWLLVEPITMYTEMLTSERTLQRLETIGNVFSRGKYSMNHNTRLSKERIVKNQSNISNMKKENDGKTNDSSVAKIRSIITKIQPIYKRFQIVGSCYQHPYVDMNSLFQKILGKSWYSHSYVRSENDSIIPCEKEIDSEHIQIGNTENKLKKFKLFLDQEGIKLLYIQRPSKNNKFNSRRYPVGVIGMTPDEYKADVLLNFCRDEKVDNIDLREELHNTGNNWDDAFYKTDHHWKAETGFWAFQIVAEKLQKEYGFSFDEKIIQSDSYNWEPRYKNNYFLGSSGKKLGRYFCDSLDSITKISPKFQTHYSIEKLSETFSQSHFEGAFEEVCLFEKELFKTATTFNLHSFNTYKYYNDGDASRVVLNKLAPNNKSILLVRDSYTCVFSPFLYGICKEVHEIDLRTYHQESLVDYVHRVKPDVVIIMANYVFIPVVSFEEKSRLDYNAR